MENVVAIEGASQAEELVLEPDICNFSSITEHVHDQVSNIRVYCRGNRWIAGLDRHCLVE